MYSPCVRGGGTEYTMDMGVWGLARKSKFQDRTCFCEALEQLKSSIGVVDCSIRVSWSVIKSTVQLKFP